MCEVTDGSVIEQIGSGGDASKKSSRYVARDRQRRCTMNASIGTDD